MCYEILEYFLPKEICNIILYKYNGMQTPTAVILVPFIKNYNDYLIEHKKTLMGAHVEVDKEKLSFIKYIIKN